jgi:nucleoside-specific outer membrane channel protein Tsx
MWSDVVEKVKAAIKEDDLELVNVRNVDSMSQNQIDAAYRIASVVMYPENLLDPDQIDENLSKEISKYHEDCDHDTTGYIRVAYFHSKNDDKEAKIDKYLTDILPKLSFEEE